MTERVDAVYYHLERHFGKKVPQCPNCGSTELWENHARASFNCSDCRYEISGHVMQWIPEDERVRTPEESFRFKGLGYPPRPLATD